MNYKTESNALNVNDSAKKVHLIKFTKEDAKFIQENFPTYYRDNSIENIERVIAETKPDALWFCITYNGKKVGIISLGKKEEGKLSWGVMIKEGYRGKGIAQEAFDLIKNKAKAQGYTTIISSCSTDNFASTRLHEKCGFNLIKTEVNQAGNEMHRWEIEI